MKLKLLLGGMAAIASLSATSVMATTAPLADGLYTITFTGAGRSDAEPVSISGSGGTRTITITSASGAQNISTTLSGTGALHGTSTARGMTMTLNGQATASSASGTFSVSQSGKTATGSFSLASRPINVAHMQMNQSASGSESTWDKICDWFAGLLQGGSTGPTTPAPSGSGSSAKGGLAPYTPPGHQ